MQKQVMIVSAALVGATVAGYWLILPPTQEAVRADRPKFPHAVAVTVPALSASALSGKALFDANCASCHGANAAGGEGGPPLVHRIYEPSHHADGAFYLAAQRGVRAHHWRFGDMPPQPQVSQQEMSRIIAYVRELQRANGIF